MGGWSGDCGKYMNGAVCLGLCGAHLAVVHSNKNALFRLHGVSVNFSESPSLRSCTHGILLYTSVTVNEGIKAITH